MLYEKLKELSNEREESMNSIIVKSGLPRGIISRIKKHSDPQISTIIKLSLYTGKDVNWLISGEKERILEEMNK